VTTGSETGRPTANFYKAFLLVQKALRAVPHDRVGQFGGKGYASVEQMIESANEALHPHGMLLVGTKGEIQTFDDLQEVVNTQTGELTRQPKKTYVFRFRALLVHADSGETLEISRECPIAPQKGRPLDMATAAADSFNLIYMIRDALMAKRGDVEIDSTVTPAMEAGREIRAAVVAKQEAERRPLPETQVSKRPDPTPATRTPTASTAQPATTASRPDPVQVAANQKALVEAAKATAETSKKLQVEDEEIVALCRLMLEGKIPADLTQQLAEGITPANAPPFLHMPEDPTAASLVEYGWTFDDPSALELEAVGTDQLSQAVEEHLKAKVKQIAGAEAIPLFKSLGGVKGKPLNGYQARLMAALAAQRFPERVKQIAPAEALPF
jgi:hypothetical protein